MIIYLCFECENRFIWIARPFLCCTYNSDWINFDFCGLNHKTKGIYQTNLEQFVWITNDFLFVQVFKAIDNWSCSAIASAMHKRGGDAIMHKTTKPRQKLYLFMRHWPMWIGPRYYQRIEITNNFVFVLAISCKQYSHLLNRLKKISRWYLSQALLIPKYEVCSFL